MRKLSSVLSRRVVRFLGEQAKKDKEAYLQFFAEFGQFIKEGVYTDFANKEDTAKVGLTLTLTLPLTLTLTLTLTSSSASSPPAASGEN